MFLKFVREIRTEDAERLVIAASKILRIKEAVDRYNYLWNSSKIMENSEKDNYFPGKDIVSEKVAPGVQNNKFQLLGPESFVAGSYLAGLIKVGKRSKGSDVRISARINEEGKMLYWMIINEPPAQSVSDFELIIDENRTNLSLIVKYFFNKKELYSEVRDILTKNRKMFTAFSGEEFTSNLISLFSAKLEEKEIPDFSMSSKNSDKELLISGQNYDCNKGNFKNIGTYYVYHSVDSELEPIKDFRICINDKNQLAIYLNVNENLFFGESSIITDKNLFKVTENPIFEKIIEENIQEWLKDIIRMKDFATAFYKNIEAKILEEVL